MKRRIAAVLSAMVIFPLALACTGGSETDPEDSRRDTVIVDVPTLPSAVDFIGPEGGTLTLENITVTIPPGALAETTEITVRPRLGLQPHGFRRYSDFYDLLPYALPLELPATVTILPTTDPATVSIFLRGRDSEPFGERPTSHSFTAVTAEISRFGTVFVSQTHPVMPAKASEILRFASMLQSCNYTSARFSALFPIINAPRWIRARLSAMVNPSRCVSTIASEGFPARIWASVPASVRGIPTPLLLVA
jgi:hypothetical protein